MNEAARKFYEDWKKKRAAQQENKLKRQGLKSKPWKSWRERDEDEFREKAQRTAADQERLCERKRHIDKKAFLTGVAIVITLAVVWIALTWITVVSLSAITGFLRIISGSVPSSLLKVGVAIGLFAIISLLIVMGARGLKRDSGLISLLKSRDGLPLGDGVITPKELFKALAGLLFIMPVTWIVAIIILLIVIAICALS
jgi:amino acid transporter